MTKKKRSKKEGEKGKISRWAERKLDMTRLDYIYSLTGILFIILAPLFAILAICLNEISESNEFGIWYKFISPILGVLIGVYLFVKSYKLKNEK